MSDNLDILKSLRQIPGHDDYNLLYDFFMLSALSIRNAVDLRPCRETYEKKFADISRKYKPEEIRIMALTLGELHAEFAKVINGGRPFDDICGRAYMNSRTSNGKTGQFFTPYHASHLCASAIIDEEMVKAKLENDPDALITIDEPSCGAGGMLVAAAERLKELGVNYSWNSLMFGTDIDERCVAMSYIQCSLLGIPAIITHGNALTLECWSEWETPAYIMGYTHFASRMREINKDTNDKKKKVENEGVCDTPPLQQRIEKEPRAKADGSGKNDVSDGTIPDMDKSGQYSLF